MKNTDFGNINHCTDKEVIDLFRCIDIENCFDPIFDPPQSFLNDCKNTGRACTPR